MQSILDCNILQTLHQRGVKGYVTFNTLIFDHELPDAAKSIAAIAEADADSIIVQDVGIAKDEHHQCRGDRVGTKIRRESSCGCARTVAG